MKYLTQTETNELLNTISKDNPTYGLIFRLMYLYGKDFKQIIQLKWSDITENTIQFKKSKFPLSSEDYTLLKQEPNNGEYIFLGTVENLEESTNMYRKKVIYYFTNTLKQLDVPSRIKHVGLSLTDLRRLRGQHLILNGVDLKLVMELYQQKPNARTQFKKYLQYDDLYKIHNKLPCTTVNDIFTHSTDLNVFELKDFKNSNQYIVTNMDESTLVLIDNDKITFVEDISDEFKDDVINIYQRNNLNRMIDGLKPSQYKLIGDCKFIKV